MIKPLRPGGPMSIRPINVKVIQKPDGTRAYLCHNPLSDQLSEAQKQPLGVDLPVIEGVIEKCQRSYEGKYPKALFGVNVSFTETERMEAVKLLQLAQAKLQALTDKEPLWAKFNQELEKRRQIYGTFGESAHVIENQQTSSITVGQTPEGIIIITVPSNIKYLYTLTMELLHLKDLISWIDLKSAKGRMAAPLGKSLAKTLHFVASNS